MNIGGGQELKDGYYVPITVADVGKRLKVSWLTLPKPFCQGCRQFKGVIKLHSSYHKREI